MVPNTKITAAGVLLIASDNKILAFARRGNLKKLGLPAGLRENNEELIKCAEREIFEETGVKITITSEDVKFTYKSDDKQEKKVDEFCVTYIKNINSKSKDIVLEKANEDEDGVAEGFALWVSPQKFISAGNSAFIDYNTALLKFAGLI